MLDTGSIWLDTILAASEGQAVIYRRGAEEVELEGVVIGQTPMGWEFTGGIIQSWQSRDFFIAAPDLILGGAVIEPEAGDLIEDEGVTYRVEQTDDGRTWRYSDEVTRTMLRVHTKQYSRR